MSGGGDAGLVLAGVAGTAVAATADTDAHSRLHVLHPPLRNAVRARTQLASNIAVESLVVCEPGGLYLTTKLAEGARLMSFVVNGPVEWTEPRKQPSPSRESRPACSEYRLADEGLLLC